MLVLPFLKQNFILIYLLIGFSFVLSRKKVVREIDVNYMWFTLGCAALLSVVVFVERYCAMNRDLLYYRIFFSVLGYWLRPACVMGLALSLNRSLRRKLIIFIPEIINMIVMSCAFFSKWVFYFNEDYKFVRGPLGYCVFIVSYLYILILWLDIRKKYDKSRRGAEAVLMISIVGCVLASAIEALEGGDLLTTSIVVSCIFYYMYIRTQGTDWDEMTSLLNRQSFYDDCKKYDSVISAVSSIDMNGLKQINDKNGHDAGDKALAKIGSCLLMASNQNVIPYRIGGDEFSILFLSCDEQKVKEILEEIHKNVNETGLSIASGYSMRKNKQSIDDLCKESDHDMYRNKSLFYQTVEHDRRINRK